AARVSAPRIILCSASPRRREILGLLGLSFDVQAMDVDETPLEGELASALGLRVATQKASAGAARFGPEPFVLAADTVVDDDGVPLGKPEDDADAVRMITLRGGRDHVVRTASRSRTAARSRRSRSSPPSASARSMPEPSPATSRAARGRTRPARTRC